MSQPTPTAAIAGIQEPEPGYTTTEFWVTVLTLAMPAVTLIWHQDFSAQIQTIAVAAAGLASAIYAVVRTLRKSAADNSRAAAVGSMTLFHEPPAPAAGDAAPVQPPNQIRPEQADLIAAGLRNIDAAFAVPASGPSANGHSTRPFLVYAGN
jgi:negative regulator of sigma E activity